MTKNRFEALEQRCQKLKKAKIMKRVLFLAIVLCVTFIFFYLSHQSDKEPVVVIVPSIKTELIGQEELAHNNKTMPHTDEKSYDTLILSPAIKEDLTQQ